MREKLLSAPFGNITWIARGLRSSMKPDTKITLVTSKKDFNLRPVPVPKCRGSLNFRFDGIPFRVR